MKFPVDYPYSPPKLRFLSPILHPNVYTVCTSSYTHIAICPLCEDEIVIHMLYYRMVSYAFPFCTLRGRTPTVGRNLRRDGTPHRL